MERGLDSVYEMAQKIDINRRTEAAALVTQAGSALDYCHSHQLGFCDVSPSNILQRQPGNYFITDTETVIWGLSQDGSLMIWDFAAPEIIETNRQLRLHTISYYSWEIFRLADQHALAAAAYWLLTKNGGQDLYLDDNLQTFPNHIYDNVCLAPDALLSPATYRVLLKATSFNPADRYPSCTAFAQALRPTLVAGNL
jgi:serine/threonine-protein kinase